MFLKKHIISTVLAALAILLIWVAANINWGKDNWKGILESDAKGYYAYLPAVFIYQDLNFSFLDEIEEKYDRKLIYYDYRRKVHDKHINKYFAGTAVLQLPFFLMAHAITSLSDGDADGYSKWYLIFITIAAIFYQLLGLFFIGKILKSNGIKDSIIAILLVVCSLGTNLFVYSIVEPGMSHVYSFALLSMFIYYAQEFSRSFHFKHLSFAVLLLGSITLVRPINFLILFSIPLLAGSWPKLKELFWAKWKLSISKKLILVMVFALPLCIQLIVYKISTGNFWVYSYVDEGFNFLDPHWWDILFSYRKGLFVYTPFYFLPFALIYFIWKRSSYLLYSWLFFFSLITYFLSSWWMWYYGGSFSSRVYVEYLPLFVLMIAFALQEVKKSLLRNISFALLFSLILLCQIQSYQYRYYIIHYSEMNQEKYWDVFLQFSP